MSMNEHQELNIYETGQTQPPKSRRGLMALVLVAVIFVAGIVRSSYLLNIPLFPISFTQGETDQPVQFTPVLQDDPAPDVPVCATGCPDPGFSGVTMTALERKIYHLPQGIYIARVHRGDQLLPGDILQQVDGVTVNDLDSFYQVIDDRQAGDTIELLVIRNGKPKNLRLTLGQPGQ